MKSVWSIDGFLIMLGENMRDQKIFFLTEDTVIQYIKWPKYVSNYNFFNFLF